MQVVINSRSVDIGDLLVEIPFTSSNIPYLKNQIPKILLAEVGAILQSNINKDIPANGEIFKYLSRPFSEMCCPFRIEPKAYRNHPLLILMFNLTGNFTRTLSLNYSKISNSCLKNRFQEPDTQNAQN